MPREQIYAATALYVAFQGAGLWQFARAPKGSLPRLAAAYATYAIGCVFCCLAIVGWLTMAGL
jgi:hypothetical protein